MPPIAEGQDGGMEHFGCDILAIGSAETTTALAACASPNSGKAEVEEVVASSTTILIAQATEVSGTGEPSAEWLEDVVQLLEADTVADTVVDFAWLMGLIEAEELGEPDTDTAGFLTSCRFLDPNVSALLNETPSPPGRPDIDEVWSTYVQHLQERWEAYQELCEAASDDPNAVALDMQDPNFEAAEKKAMACQEVLRVLETLPDPPSARCALPDGEFFDMADMPAELAEFDERLTADGDSSEDVSDLDPLAGPTGNELIELAPGTNTFAWFEPAFTVTNQDPWYVLESTVGYILIIESFEPQAGWLEMIAPTQLADPNSPFTFAADENDRPTVAVPDDLTDWIAQMPVIAQSTKTTVGGLDATYWQIQFDREASDSSVVLVLNPNGVDGWGVSIDEDLHLWHIEHPDGPLFVLERASRTAGEDLYTPGMLGGLSFP